MGRKGGGRPVHGWIILDKPAGMSSAKAVAVVRRLTGAAKAGHGGTLDPLATGILPIALGEATKTVSYVMDGSKTYRFRLRWGEARETDDTEGAVCATSPVRPAEGAIHAVLPRFEGEIDQVPPVYSAIKVDGKRAYALARAAEAVTLKSRKVRIESLKLLGLPDCDHADFEVRSGKGVYIRALARDLAQALGTVGHVAWLRRTEVGPYSEADAISLDKLETLGHSAPLHAVETALDDIPALALTAAEAARLRNGQAISLLSIAERQPLGGMVNGGILCVLSECKPVALARIEQGQLHAVRVLNL